MMQVYRDAELLSEQLSQAGAVSQVDPIALAAALLVVHAISSHYPVEAFRTGNRSREPNLLVRRLLVENVATGRRYCDG